MQEDKYHIEMEDIAKFPLEKSIDYAFWEEISFAELNQTVLDKLSDEKLKTFFGVIRNGSAFKLNEYFYRINSD